MPTVLIFKNLHFMIHTRNEHRPAHIHVYIDDFSLKVNLETFEVMENKGFRSKEVKLAIKLTKENKDAFLETWEDYNE